MSALIPNLAEVNPIYEVFDGWNMMTTGINSFNELPQNAQRYIKYISDFIGVPVKIISTGPGRDEIIQV